MVLFYNLTSDKFSAAKYKKLFDFLFSFFALSQQHDLLEIIFVNPIIMKKLNRQYLGRHSITDVLSFPQDQPECRLKNIPRLFGSIYLCPEYIKKQDGGLFDAEPYLVHGFLHLTGLDHSSPSEKKHWSNLLQKIDNNYQSKNA